jgi:hypothetical protein
VKRVLGWRGSALPQRRPDYAETKAVVKHRFLAWSKWGVVVFLIGVIGYVGYRAWPSLVEAALLITAGTVGGLALVLVALAIGIGILYVIVLWAIFPVFVFSYLRSIDRRIARSNQLLEIITRK